MCGGGGLKRTSHIPDPAGVLLVEKSYGLSPLLYFVAVYLPTSLGHVSRVMLGAGAGWAVEYICDFWSRI